VVSTSKKATFSLPADVLAAVDHAVSEGAAPSKNAFVEQALVQRLDDLRRERRRERWLQAASDPLFMKDVADVEADFRYADAETARRIV
jgi:hypothetical protein